MLNFTGKERDAETGLDYFGARYYSGAQGRFISVDPLIVSNINATMPQSWNRYSYVGNNPFRNVDPTGEWWTESWNPDDPYRWIDDCSHASMSCYERIVARAKDRLILYGPTGPEDKVVLQSIGGRVNLKEIDGGYWGFIFQKDSITATWLPLNAAVDFLKAAMFNLQLTGLVVELNDCGNRKGIAFGDHKEHMAPRNGIDMRFLTEEGGINDINKSDYEITNRFMEIAARQGYSDAITGFRTEERLVNGKIVRVRSMEQYPGRHLPDHPNHIHLARPRN
jgi:RHS repeat-associated protein